MIQRTGNAHNRGVVTDQALRLFADARAAQHGAQGIIARIGLCRPRRKKHRKPDKCDVFHRFLPVALLSFSVLGSGYRNGQQ
jgi:hypothetical protein